VVHVFAYIHGQSVCLPSSCPYKISLRRLHVWIRNTRDAVSYLFNRLARSESLRANGEEASSHSNKYTASVKELSLYGCYVDTRAPFSPKTPVLVKIFKADEYFEAKATVIYAHPTLGMGLAFRDVRPDFRIVRQKWLLAALQENGPKP
jgi:hypothetical protein